MNLINVYAAVQNGCILDTFDTYEEAKQCIDLEMKNDWLKIMFTKKLRNLLRRAVT